MRSAGPGQAGPSWSHELFVGEGTKGGTPRVCVAANKQRASAMCTYQRQEAAWEVVADYLEGFDT